MRAARIALVVAVGLLPAASAHADVTIGSALPPPSGGTQACAGGCTYSPTVIAGRQTAAPSRGVITRWRIRGGPAIPVRFVVLRRPSGLGATGPAELVGRSAEVTPVVDNVSNFPVRMPIMAGEYIGIEPAANVQAGYFAQVATSTAEEWTPPVAPDANPLPFASQGGLEILVNADIEPDQDGDGYGDTTQDADDDGDGVPDATDACDTVVGPAPSGCPAPANRAPTVRFRTPVAGTAIGPSFRVVLDVADDKGSPTVSVFDDDGTVCVLHAAPYACTWTPTGADVGRATLLASAVDSAGLSTLGIVRVRVSRFAATLTKKAKRSKRRLRVSGKLVLPDVVTREQGCSGEVTVRVRKVTKRVALTGSCKYFAVLKVRTGRPRVRFGGNSVIAPT
jgi:Bacterial Ig domain